MEMKQKIVPLALTAKLFPFTRDAKFQPYLGGGVQFNRWQYTEVGEFLDYDTGEIFRDSFTDDGVETGPVFLAGLRFPVGTSLLLGGEWRYATAKADLDPDRSGSSGKASTSAATPGCSRWLTNSSRRATRQRAYGAPIGRPGVRT